MFGPHLTLDLYGCDKKKLNDIRYVYKLLDKLPEKIGMHKMHAPHVTHFGGNPKTFDKGGVSAFVLITESHISIHTFPHQRYASVDIFSCKEFDVQNAEQILAKAFDAKKVEENLIMRGREFPKDVEKSATIVRRERKKMF